MREPIEVLRPVSQGEWDKFVKQTESDNQHHDARRQSPRKPIECYEDIQLKIYDSDGVTSRLVKITEISAGGVTCWTGEEVPEGAKVQFIFAGEFRHWQFRGRIVHCTQTVGGFKVGIRIEFSQ
jgi:hypothetical protein